MFAGMQDIDKLKVLKKTLCTVEHSLCAEMIKTFLAFN